MQDRWLARAAPERYASRPSRALARATREIWTAAAASTGSTSAGDPISVPRALRSRVRIGLYSPQSSGQNQVAAGAGPEFVE